jgi:hypothetical protein
VSSVIKLTSKPCYQSNIDEVEPVNFESIPQRLTTLNQWVLWKDKKIPHQASGRKAKVSNINTWQSFDAIKQAYQTNDNWLGVGFVLTELDPYFCIDLDHVVDLNTGELKPEAQKVVELLGSYTEISVSGTGLHIFGKGEIPSITNKSGQFECYSKGRYIAITGDILDGYTEINDVTTQQIIRAHELITQISSPHTALNISGLTECLSPASSKFEGDIEQITCALTFIPADDRGIWLKVGMAIHSTNLSDGFDIWVNWSSQSDKFDMQDSIRVWKSFKHGGISIGTLFYLAEPFGYQTRTDLHAQYIYVTQENAYFDVQSRELIRPDVLNRLHKSEFKGVKGNPSATTFFDDAPIRKEHSSTGKRVVKSLGWLPVDNEIIELDGELYANTYRGIQIRPEKGDISQFLKLVHFICGEYAELVLDHMAFTCQYPLKKIRWQVLLSGDARTGKSMMLRPLVRIFGSAGISIDPDTLNTGWANAYVGKKVVVLEEVYRPEDKSFYNGLKTKLANDDLDMLNPKYQPTITQQNLYSMYLCTNHGDALRFERNEDKLLVISTPPESARWLPEEYAALGNAIDEHMVPNIYHFLLNRDVSEFSYAVLPVRTAAMLAMVESGKPDYEAAIEELILCNQYPFNKIIVHLGDLKTELLDKGYKCSDKSITRVLKKNGWCKYRGTKTINRESNNTPSFYTKRIELNEMGVTDIYEWYIEHIKTQHGFIGES